METIAEVGGEVFVEGGGIDNRCIYGSTVVSREVRSNMGVNIVLNLSASEGNMVILFDMNSQVGGGGSLLWQ